MTPRDPVDSPPSPRAARRCSAAPRRRADRRRRPRRRPAPTSRRWRRSGSAAGRPGPTARRLAADYLVAELKKMGAQPLPGQKDFRLPFSFTAGVKDGGTTLQVAAPPDGDARAVAQFDAHARGAGAVLLGQRRGQRRRWCSPATAWSCPSRRTSATTATPRSTSRTRSSSCCATSPRTPTRRRARILSRYADLRYKAMQARQRGARALLVVTGPRSPNAGETIPMSFDTALAGSGIVAASVVGRRGQGALRRRQGPHARRHPEVVRLRQPAHRRLRAARRHGHGQDRGRAREAGRLQRRRLPAGHGAHRAAQAVGRARRALRPPRARQPRQLAGRQGRRRQDPLRRRRQRVGHRRGARRRPRAGRDASGRGTSLLALLVGRGDRPDRLERVRHHAAGAASISWPPTSTSTWSAACRTTSSPCRRSARARAGGR